MSEVWKSATVIVVVSIIGAQYLASKKPGAPIQTPSMQTSSMQTPPAQNVALTPRPAAAPQHMAAPVMRSSNMAFLPAGQLGHYFAKVETRETTLDMLVDTGATKVALTAEDAQKLRIYPNPGDYKIPTSTANGIAYSAPVKLDSVRIDGVVVYDVDALVAQPGKLSQSLLGMSFLTKLSSYNVQDNQLILHQ